MPKQWFFTMLLWNAVMDKSRNLPALDKRGALLAKPFLSPGGRRCHGAGVVSTVRLGRMDIEGVHGQAQLKNGQV